MVSIDRAIADAHYGMNDFRLIRYGESRMFRPADARAIHLAQVRWLQAKLAEEFAGSTVVATHHLPHRQSIHAAFDPVLTINLQPPALPVRTS